MTIANINIGTSPNDGTGDTLRHGFQIVNNNFSYVNSILGGAGNVVTNTISADTITANTANITNVNIGNLTTTTTLTATGGTFSGNIYTGNLNATGRVTAANITVNATVSAANATISSNVTAAGAVISGPVFGSGFFYSNGVALTSTGNLTLTSSNIAGFNSNDGRGTVINFLPNVDQAPNGQFLTVNAASYPNISINSGNPAIATLMLGQSNHGIWLTGTGSTGNITVQPYGTGTKINSILSANSIEVAGNITGSGTTLNLINVNGIQNSVGNQFNTNVSNVVVGMWANVTRYRSLDVNATATITYESVVVPGVHRELYIRNKSGSTQYVLLPNNNNNKGSSNISIANGITATFAFTSFDTDAANIAVTIANT